MRCNLSSIYKQSKDTVGSFWRYVSSYASSVTSHRNPPDHEEGTMEMLMKWLAHILKQVFLIVGYLTLLGLTVAVTIVLLYVTFMIIWKASRFVYHATRRLLRNSNSFRSDEAMGLSSESFDLSDNIESQDSRKGLETLSKIRVWIYMLWYRESFDEARTRYVQNKFSYHNIGQDGRPQDPKAVFFDQ